MTHVFRHIFLYVTGKMQETILNASQRLCRIPSIFGYFLAIYIMDIIYYVQMYIYHFPKLTVDLTTSVAEHIWQG